MNHGSKKTETTNSPFFFMENRLSEAWHGYHGYGGPCFYEIDGWYRRAPRTCARAPGAAQISEGAMGEGIGAGKRSLRLNCFIIQHETGFLNPLFCYISSVVATFCELAIFIQWFNVSTWFWMLCNLAYHLTVFSLSLMIILILFDLAGLSSTQ